MCPSESAARRAAAVSPDAEAISAWAASNGARRRSPKGGHSFHGRSSGLVSASSIIVDAPTTSPCANRNRAKPGWADQARACAEIKADSAPARSPFRRRILPSSTNGHPNSRRIHGRSSSHASNASSSARSHGPDTLSSSARCTRQRPLIPPKAAPWRQRSIMSVHSTA